VPSVQQELLRELWHRRVAHGEPHTGCTTSRRQCLALWEPSGHQTEFIALPSATVAFAQLTQHSAATLEVCFEVYCEQPG
jgi:hypothetical protein